MTVSEGHPFHYAFEGRDLGGSFYTQKKYPEEASPKGSPHDFPNTFYVTDETTSPGGELNVYRGPIFPTDPVKMVYPDSVASNTAQLYVMGTTAIARCKPGQPVADLSTSLAELYREGIPAIAGSALWKKEASRGRNIPQSASDEYLNWTFGWAPIINDIKDVAKAISDGDKLLRQYERDAGKIVRRGYKFPTVESKTINVTNPLVNRPFGYGTGAVQGALSADGFASVYSQTVVSTKVERWFSGAFTYYLPDNYYSRNKWKKAAAQLEVLLGVELTPEVVWNLVPWSWAADWVANYGDIFSNVGDFGSDSLVMPYGYMMETATSTHTYECYGHRMHGVPDPLTFSLNLQVKQRVKASPFGFGLNWQGFTPKQLAILGSIGITRT